MSNWIREHGQDYEVPKEITQAFADISYHNDTCPCFTRHEYKDADFPALRLWVEHPDPAMRESVNAPDRFCVVRCKEDGDCQSEEVLYTGNNVLAAVQAMGEAKAQPPDELETDPDRFLNAHRQANAATITKVLALFHRSLACQSGLSVEPLDVYQQAFDEAEKAGYIYGEELEDEIVRDISQIEFTQKAKEGFERYYRREEILALLNHALELDKLDKWDIGVNFEAKALELATVWGWDHELVYDGDHANWALKATPTECLISTIARIRTFKPTSLYRMKVIYADGSSEVLNFGYEEYSNTVEAESFYPNGAIQNAGECARTDIALQLFEQIAPVKAPPFLTQKYAFDPVHGRFTLRFELMTCDLDQLCQAQIHLNRILERAHIVPDRPPIFQNRSSGGAFVQVDFTAKEKIQAPVIQALKRDGFKEFDYPY